MKKCLKSDRILRNNSKSLYAGIIFAAVFAVLLVRPIFAGSLDAPGGSPTDPGVGAMFTSEDIYNRLLNGSPGAKRVGPFSEPAAGPGSTVHTLNDIMGIAPAVDSTNGAKPSEVLSGKTFWGLTQGAWGLQTGTFQCSGTAAGDAVAADVLAGKTFSGASGNGIAGTMTDNGAFALMCGVSDQPVNPGYYSGGTLTGDPNLVPANIRSGVSIFGVNGSAVQASGTATAAQVLSGVTFSNSGGTSIGTMPDNGAVNITPGATAQIIPAGYHNGAGSVSGDANLVAGNIKSGVSIFGVSGTAITRTCSGTLSSLNRWCDQGNGTVMDMTTGLVWLKNATCMTTLAGINNSTGQLNWSDAVIWSSAVRNGVCGLSDNSVEGDWRLPTKSELIALTSGTEAVSSGGPGPFGNVQMYGYWSATTYADITSNAWGVFLLDGYMYNNDKTNASSYVWPVRGGQ